MPAVNKPIDLKPAEALAANTSAPTMVAAVAAAQVPAATASSSGAATCAIPAMWAPLAATVAEVEGIRHGLNAGGERRIAGIYQRQTEAVTTLIKIDDENRHSLTLIPTGGTVAV